MFIFGQRIGLSSIPRSPCSFSPLSPFPDYPHTRSSSRCGLGRSFLVSPPPIIPYNIFGVHPFSSPLGLSLYHGRIINVKVGDTPTVVPTLPVDPSCESVVGGGDVSCKEHGSFPTSGVRSPESIRAPEVPVVLLWVRVHCHTRGSTGHLSSSWSLVVQPFNTWRSTSAPP